MIKAGQFYQTKNEVNGMKTPGGYVYVYSIEGNSVKVGMAERPTTEDLTGGAFTLQKDDLEKIIID